MNGALGPAAGALSNGGRSLSADWMKMMEEAGCYRLIALNM